MTGRRGHARHVAPLARFTMLTTLLIAPALLLGCGAQPPASVGATDPDVSGTASRVETQATSDEPSTTSEPVATEPERVDTSVADTVGTSNPSTQLYTAITTVIDRPEIGPRLCLGGQLDSAPPICGDVPVLGLDWAAVAGAFHSGDVTWMERALVTGTYDGSSLTLTEPPRVATDAEFSSAFDHRNGPIPCPEPADGWPAEGARFPPGSDYNEYIQRVDDYTSAAPDWGGVWVEFGNSPIDIASHPEKVILVELFTGDLARHEIDLRAIWPGALCVAPSTMASAKIEALAAKISQEEQSPDSLDPVMRSSAMVDYSRDAIRVFVPVASPSIQAAFDKKYGPGLVLVEGALKPVANS